MSDPNVSANASNFSVANPCHQPPFYYHADFTQIPAVLFAFVVLYLIVIFLSVCGNVLVIYTVWRNKYMHTVTNFYIVNLAVSDLLVSSFVMPLKLLEYTAPCEWQVFHSDLLCSFQYYLLPIFVFASVLTLVSISLERFYAIVYPFASMKIHSKSRTRKILAVTWLVPVVVAAPYLYCGQYTVNLTSDYGQISRQICNDKFANFDVMMYGPEAADSGRFRRGYFIALFVLLYVIPTLIVVATCIRIVICLLIPVSTSNNHNLNDRTIGARQQENKRKVARMVIVVASAFVLSWMPFYVVNIVSQLQTVSFLRRGNFLFTMLIVHLFGFLNSCVNPFIYNAMSEKFRKHFRLVLTSIFYCYKRRRGTKREYTRAALSQTQYGEATSATDIQLHRLSRTSFDADIK